MDGVLIGLVEGKIFTGNHGFLPFKPLGGEIGFNFFSLIQ